MKTLYLCGAGNAEGVRLALNVLDATGRWQRVVILDDDPARHGSTILGVPIAGGFERLSEAAAGSQAVNLVARTTRGRRGAAEKIASYGVPFTSLIDPSVDVRGVELGAGVTIYRNATVSALSKIGAGAVIFAGANAGHGATVGPGAVLAPGAVINARVVLGEGAYVGTNASVLPDLRVGAWATIGANSSVIEDVPEGASVLGVPAQVVGVARVEAAAVVAAPSGDRDDPELVAKIAELWAELLHRSEVRPDDNFFDAGGTSLLAMQMRLRLQARLQRELALTDVFRFPTVRALAAHLSEGATAGPSAAEERGRLRRERARRGMT